jgi:replicative DNA helicase
MSNDDLKHKASITLQLKEQYTRAYSNEDYVNGKRLELEYVELRKEVLNAVDSEIKRVQSIPIATIKEEVANMLPIDAQSTGIISLDKELVPSPQSKLGGFGLGNYIQIAGSRGAGKTSLLLKIMTSLSLNQRVCWMDFEMGKKRVTKKLKSFVHDDKNLLYYNASRELSDIIDEIKLLTASGVANFVIDSTMKINTKDITNLYERFSKISQELSSLTSTLHINIFIINQMSQNAEKENSLSLKHGNDAEYDADYIFYILKMKKTDARDRIIKDNQGFPIYDESYRLIKCTKNREYDRLFSVKVAIEEIFSKN